MLRASKGVVLTLNVFTKKMDRISIKGAVSHVWCLKEHEH